MDGMKGTSVIHTCRRCGEFRDVENEPDGCPTCLMVGVVSHFTDAHPLCDVSNDDCYTSAEELLCMLVVQPNAKEC